MNCKCNGQDCCQMVFSADGDGAFCVECKTYVGPTGPMVGWLAGVALLILLLGLGFSTKARAQEHNHPPQDVPIHEKFYSKWTIPGTVTESCCNKQDCYTTQFKQVDGRWYALRREDGAWIEVPEGAFEENRTDLEPQDSPDGQNHVCMQKPGNRDRVYCAVLGGGI